MNSEPNTETYIITCYQAGQPRPYADSFYEYAIEYTATAPYRSDGINEATVKKVFKALCHSFEEPASSWAAPKLNFCRAEGDKNKHGQCKKWRICVSEAFTD